MFYLLILNDALWHSFQANLFSIGYVWRSSFPNFLLEKLLEEQLTCMSLNFYPKISENTEIWQEKGEIYI